MSTLQLLTFLLSKISVFLTHLRVSFYFLQQCHLSFLESCLPEAYFLLLLLNNIQLEFFSFCELAFIISNSLKNSILCAVATACSVLSFVIFSPSRSLSASILISFSCMVTLLFPYLKFFSILSFFYPKSISRFYSAFKFVCKSYQILSTFSCCISSLLEFSLLLELLAPQAL